MVSAYAPDTESPSVRTSPFASPEVQPGLEESTNKPMHRQIHPAMSFNRMSIVTDFSSVADNKSEEVLEEVLLILKWGGVLTHAGRQQAEDLGRMFRMVMYPRRCERMLYTTSSSIFDLSALSQWLGGRLVEASFNLPP